MLKMYKYRWWLIFNITLITILLNGYLLKPKVHQLFLMVEQIQQLKIHLHLLKKSHPVAKPFVQAPLREIEALKQLLGPLDGLSIRFQERMLYLSFHTDWAGLINFLNIVENDQRGFLLEDIRCQIEHEKFIVQANVKLINRSLSKWVSADIPAPINPFCHTQSAIRLSMQSLPLASLHWVGYIVQNNIATAWVALPDHQLIKVHEHDHLSVSNLEVLKITATTIELKDAQKKIILHMD